MSLLPICPAHALEQKPPERRWLIESLWSAEAVGIVGGEPKCCKSFLALDMAVSVASGTACLRRFAVPSPGRVLLYAAEDALHVVRRRLEGICAAARVDLESLDLQVITASALRLDVPADRESLSETVAHLRPRLLVLDPFVRLHRSIDENNSGEVAPLLAFLRELQRLHNLAVVLVHHAKKGAAKARAGQSLRGSSEFHAWGDSNLYLRRSGEALNLSIEHRAAPSRTALPLGLQAHGDALALALEDLQPSQPPSTATASAAERVEDALANSQSPLSVTAIREACRMRTQTVTACLAELVRAGRATKTNSGYTSVRRT
jgi:hypothetical protein